MPKLKNNWGRLLIVLAIPLTLLAIDAWRFPLLFSKYTPPAPLNVNDLLAHGSSSLGVYRGHRIYASIDDIAAPNYLAPLSSRTNGLLISGFSSQGSGAQMSGALQAAVMAKLDPANRVRLTDAISSGSASCAGEVKDVPLQIPQNQRSEFVVDRVFLVLLPEGRPDADKLTAQIRSAILCWQRDGLDDLIVPPLAVRLDDHGEQALSLSEFYQDFLAAIPEAEHPDRLYVSLYQGWPTRELEDAASAFNTAWGTKVTDETGDFVVNRQEIRLPLIALVLCLFVCGFYVRYTLRTFLTIALAFMSLGFGVDKWVTPLAAGSNATHHLVLTVCVLLIMAVTFPLIVLWNPAAIMGKEAPV